MLDNSVLLAAGGDYQISRSVRLRSSASAYFSRTAGTSTSSQKGTISFWVKRGSLSTTNTQYLYQSSQNSAPYRDNHIGFLPGNNLEVYFAYQTSVGGGWNNSIYLNTSAVYRDTSAWYHVVVAWDTTQATASNRAKLYVNGQQVTAFSTATYPTLNENLVIDTSGYTNFIGWSNGGGVFLQVTPFDGYVTEFYRVDGQALDASSFGETDVITGVWKPKKYTGTYGTNGFYLNFSDNSAATAAAIGKDYSGNGNNWTPNNISLTAGATYDSMLDVPTLWSDRGNYATMNPLESHSTAIFRDGNLSSNATAANTTAKAGIYVSSGKWYCEFNVTTQSGGHAVGIVTNASITNTIVGGTADGYGYASTALKYNNFVSASYGGTWATGDVIGIALDLDAGTLTFYKNGVSQGVAYSGISGTFTFAYSGGTSSYVAANFGQRPFAYTPPTGFKALNTQNLPDSLVKKGNSYFDATTYSGTSATNSITNSGGFSPDFVWLKGRSSAYNHALFDTTRGARNILISNSTNAEATEPAGSSLTSFDAAGFTLGAGAPTSAAVNASGQTFVGWQWKKGATPSFDIVTFTSTSTSMTVGHNLGAVPNLIILKRRDSADNWFVNHSSFATRTGNYLVLNSTAAVASSATTFTGFSSSSVSFGSGLMVNAAQYSLYLFSEVPGFSRFGSYTGNGSADGPFVYTGHRPRFILIKRTDTTGSWYVHDTARGTVNVLTPVLYADLSNAEGNYAAGTGFDVLSNGFKARTTNAEVNASGGTYIYAAFAENPFKYSLAR